MSSWFQKVAERILSRQEFENLVERVFNRHKDYLKEDGIMTWHQWLQEQDTYNISLVLESDHDIYDKFLRQLPEEINAYTLIEMYKNNELSTQGPPRYQFERIPIEPTPVEHNVPWQTQPIKLLTPEQVQQIWQTASQRRSRSNAEVVDYARKEIYLAFNTDTELAEKLGIRPAELNRKMRSYTGLPIKQKKLQEMLNQNVPEEHQWIGISNSSFMGRQTVSHDDLDQFVKDIEVTSEGQSAYGGSQGDFLRSYIMNAFMSIDTRILYDNLSFKIGQLEKRSTRGQYNNSKKLITIADVNPNTVAHEIGHYLDYKWAEEIWPHESAQPLSSNPYISTNNSALKLVGRPQLEWAGRYRAFINHLMDKSDIHSAYTQSPSEVFARFVDKFVAWASGTEKFRFSYYSDRFEQRDFHIFVQLLQEKSFLNAKYPRLTNSSSVI